MVGRLLVKWQSLAGWLAETLVNVPRSSQLQSRFGTWLIAAAFRAEYCGEAADARYDAARHVT